MLHEPLTTPELEAPVAMRFRDKAFLAAVTTIIATGSIHSTASAAAGDIDTTFGSGGRTITGITSGNFSPSNESMYAIAVQADGKIIVAGSTDVGNGDALLLRYDTDGSRDETFGSNGQSVVDFGADETATSIAIQSDGKIVVAGYRFTAATRWDVFLARYTTNGSPDETFSTGGYVSTNLSGTSSESAYGVAIQSDGKIVVTGQSDATGNDDALVARYLTNGTLDNTFGTGGIVTLDVSGGSNDYANGVAIQSDGKIVVAGGTDATGNTDVLLARYTTSGTLDTTFDTDGIVTSNVGGTINDYASAVALQPDGKIVVAGTIQAATNDVLVNRYEANGTRDTFTSRDIGGRDGASSISLQSDGKILIAGWTDVLGNDDVLVARLDSALDLDATFGTGGIVKTDIGGDDDSAYGIAVSPSGQVYVVADTVSATSDDVGVVGYTSTGALDTDFDTDGKLVTDAGGHDEDASAIAMQSDGKMLVAGYVFDSVSKDDILLARYDSQGRLDATFGTNGVSIININGASFDWANDVAVQPDGKIVVVGGSGNDLLILRRLADGSADTAFGTNGFTTVSGGANTPYSGYAIALRPSGEIVIAGEITSANGNDVALLQFDSNGALDTTFGTNGVVTTNVSAGSSDRASAIVLQPDGKVVVAGRSFVSSTSDVLLIRYHSDGTLDTTFGTGGIVTTDVNGLDAAFGVAVQPDGKIVVAGETYVGGMHDDILVVRYEASGVHDPTFGSNGIATVDNSNQDELANAVAVQSDGHIVVAGETSPANGDNDVIMTRFTSAGTLDTSFDSDGVVVTNFGGDDYAPALALQSDGKIVLVGSTTVGGTDDLLIARYNASSPSGGGAAPAPVVIAPPTTTTPPTTTPSNEPPAAGVVLDLPSPPAPLAPSNQLVVGGSVTVTIDGFVPGETVQLVVMSTPQLLGRATAGPDGTVTVSGVLPDTLEPGDHVLAVYAPDSGRGYAQAFSISDPTPPQLPITGRTGPHIWILASLVSGCGLLLALSRRLVKSHDI